MKQRVFDYFTGAQPGWRDRARVRLLRAKDKYGAAVGSYIDRRLAATKWGTYDRRRWSYIRFLHSRTLAVPDRGD